MTKKFYVTTPIYYPSGELHLGHAYTTTLADIMKRYKIMQGYDTFFVTGSDEHGQKIEQKAKQEKQKIMDYLDNKVNSFKFLWKKLDINYDKFIRTTDEYHIKTVQLIFEKLLKTNYIYKGNYQGLYCISCEEFLNSDQIDTFGLCKISQTKPETISEETYFLKTSMFQDFATNLMNTDFLQPDYRRHEMINNFLKTGLKDLSITRVSFKWGIPIKEDSNHVIYVWLDALTNYITALGYQQKQDSNFQNFWNDEKTEILQLAGKEIIRFHAIYWPIILKTLNLRLPNTLLGHGWILNKDEKMSKSLGNVINPLDLIDEFGSDALRFYIANDLPTERDGNFSKSLFIESFNVNLANNFGNLISRVHNMIELYFEGKINNLQNIDNDIIEQGQETIKKYIDFMDNYKISDSIKIVLNLGVSLNKYIEINEPWNLYKNQQFDQLEKVLSSLQRNIIIMAYLLKPIIIKKYEDILEQLGVIDSDLSFSSLKTFRNIDIKKINQKKVVFQRIKI